MTDLMFNKKIKSTMKRDSLKRLVFVDKRCPKCGSSNYVGGQDSGRCYACGYVWGNS